MNSKTKTLETLSVKERQKVSEVVLHVQEDCSNSLNLMWIRIQTGSRDFRKLRASISISTDAHTQKHRDKNKELLKLLLCWNTSKIYTIYMHLYTHKSAHVTEHTFMFVVSTRETGKRKSKSKWHGYFSKHSRGLKRKWSERAIQ